MVVLGGYDISGGRVPIEDVPLVQVVQDGHDLGSDLLPRFLWRGIFVLFEVEELE